MNLFRLITVVVSLAVGAFSYAQEKVTVPAFDEEKFQWKTGQIIGISQVNDPSAGISFFFQALTGSLYNHVGVVVLKEGAEALDGKKSTVPMVYESYIFEPIEKSGARVVPLRDFLARANLNSKKPPMVNVVELKEPLTEQQQADLVSKMDEMIANGVRYNFVQDHDPKGKVMNCAEFVLAAFDAIGVNDVGKVTPYAELNIQAFGGKALEHYDKYFFLQGDIDVQKFRTVAPVSVMTSPKVKIVAANFATGFVPDAHILGIWEREGGMPYVAGQRAYLATLFLQAKPATPEDIRGIIHEMSVDFRPRAGTKAYTNTHKFWEK